MNSEHYLIVKLAETMAQGSTLESQIAIGCVIRNWAESRGDWWPFIQKGMVPSDAHDPSFQKTLWAAEEIYYRRQPDVTEGGLDFFRDPPEGCGGWNKIGEFYFVKSSGNIRDRP
jgi:hypothetical protein